MLLLQQAVGGLPGLSLQQSEKTTVVSVAVSSSEAGAPLDSADGAPLDSADDDDDASASASEEGAEPPSDLEAALDEEAEGPEQESGEESAEGGVPEIAAEVRDPPPPLPPTPTPSPAAAPPPSPSPSVVASSPPAAPAAPPASTAPAGPDTGPLPLMQLSIDEMSNPEMALRREAQADAAELSTMAALPTAAVLSAGENVSFSSLRAAVRDELCGAVPAPPAAEPPPSCTAGLPFSEDMRAFLEEYASRHAGARARWAASVAHAAGSAPLRDSRWILYLHCCGGFGDQLKGFANVLLASLLAPRFRPFLMRWEALIAMEDLWRPCPFAGGERSGGIDWLLPAGLPFSGTSTGGLEASAEAWSGLGLSTQGVAWAESEDAARNDVAHATSTGVAVVAGWGNYLRAALWTAPYLLRLPELSAPSEAWWLAPGGGAGYGRRRPAGPPSGAPAAEPQRTALSLNAGARRVDAELWCRLPPELRGMLRLGSLCRAGAAAAAAAAAAAPRALPPAAFSEWQLAPVDGSSPPPAPAPETGILDADASWETMLAAAQTQTQAQRRLAQEGRWRAPRARGLRSPRRAGGGNHSLGPPEEDAGSAPGARRAASAASAASAGAQRAPSSSGARRRLQPPPSVCAPMHAGESPVAARARICRNPLATGSQPSGWSAPGGLGALSTNLGLQLLDWLVWPQPRFLRALAPILRVFRPGRQFLVGVHMRSGFDVGNGIAEPQALTGLSACCVAAAVAQLAAAFGPREEVLVLVFSDLAASRLLVKSSLRGAVLSGMRVRVVDYAPHNQIVHTAARPNGQPGEALSAGNLDVFVEHFLLSSAHALVRSRSGFSESAQAWGRVPLVLQLKFSEQTCIDVSHAPFESMTAWERRRRLDEWWE